MVGQFQESPNVGESLNSSLDVSIVERRKVASFRFVASIQALHNVRSTGVNRFARQEVVSRSCTRWDVILGGGSLGWAVQVVKHLLRIWISQGIGGTVNVKPMLRS